MVVVEWSATTKTTTIELAASRGSDWPRQASPPRAGNRPRRGQRPGRPRCRRRTAGHLKTRPAWRPIRREGGRRSHRDSARE